VAARCGRAAARSRRAAPSGFRPHAGPAARNPRRVVLLLAMRRRQPEPSGKIAAHATSRLRPGRAVAPSLLLTSALAPATAGRTRREIAGSCPRCPGPGGKAPSCRISGAGHGSRAFAAIRVASAGGRRSVFTARQGRSFFGVGRRARIWSLCGAGRPIVRAAVLVLFFVLSCGSGAPRSRTAAPYRRVRDSQAQGLAGGLARVLIEDPRYRVLNRTHPGAALVHGENEWLQPVQRFTGARRPISRSSCSRQRPARPARSGASVRFRTDEWRAAYAARANKILTLLTTAGLR